MTSAHGEGWAAGGGDGAEEPRVVIRDRRRIDPDSGEVRAQQPAAEPAQDGSGAALGDGSGAGPGSAADEPGADTGLAANLRTQLAERTGDLQRLKAEFDNYRRRVERDRQVSADMATGRLLSALLPTLDDIARARDHGDLEGPFKAVAESLEVALEGAGLERFGAPGEVFDPMVHDALMHTYRPDVSEATCVEVFRSGYRHAGRVLRPAQVTVAEPPPDATVPEAAEAAASTASAASTAAVDNPSESAAQDQPPGWASGSAVPDDTGSIPRASGGDETVSAE